MHKYTTILLALLAMVNLPARAQFDSLATDSEGSRLFFTSTLALKGSLEPRHGKALRATGA